MFTLTQLSAEFEFVCFVCLKYGLPICSNNCERRGGSMNVEEEADAAQSKETEGESRKKYELLEDLPGVGPATAQKLREMGYHTIESLAMATARELEPAGISDKKAFAIIETARQSVGVSFIRADELLRMRKYVLRLTSGSKVVDRLLDGGLGAQTITEFYGGYGSGKSRNCPHVCVMVQLRPG